MTNLPRFTAEENMNRVLMDKRTSYLMVEGSSDVPIYSEVLNHIVKKHGIDKNPVTLFGGGKLKIKNWIDRESPKNVSVILDMDFDDPQTDFGSEKIVALNRYSIENYYFDDAVLFPVIAHILSCSADDLNGVIDFKELECHWHGELKELITVIFYYQKHYSGERCKWSNIFINKDHSNWKLCGNRINKLKEDLLGEMNVDLDKCLVCFEKAFSTGWNPKTNFPGKLLVESLYRYIRNICNDIKKGACSVITNKKSLCIHLSPRLINNIELERIMLRSIESMGPSPLRRL